VVEASLALLLISNRSLCASDLTFLFSIGYDH
jgi:hypothetical protein